MTGHRADVRMRQRTARVVAEPLHKWLIVKLDIG